MEYATGRMGRILVARLFEGEAVYAAIEELARREKVASAVVLVVGGARGQVIVGPRAGDGPIDPMRQSFDQAHEMLGIGTLFADAGVPRLHMHAALGRERNPIVGCPREGLDVFLVLEVTIIEIAGMDARRALDEASGFKLLRLIGGTQVNL